MCGIVGILSNSKKVEEYLIGYDSAGIVTFNEQNESTISKYATDLQKDNITTHQNGISGLGHTRWATCGPKTRINAHPHCDQDQNIFLIHNGTIEEPSKLRDELIQLGVQVASQTDSELIAQFIAYFMKQGMTLIEATKHTLKDRIRGTWGLAIIDRNHPGQMLICRNGSPIHVGLGEDSIYVASEKIAFQQYTNNFISLQDGEMILLDIKNIQEFYNNQSQRVSVLKETEIIKKTFNPQFGSFFEQEVEEQPEALLRAMGNGSRLSFIEDDNVKLGGLELNNQQISKIENLVIFGCGTSLYAGQFAAYFYKKLQIFNTVTCVEASDFSEYDLPQQQGGAIFISQSGETKDITNCIQICNRKGLFCIGIVNVVGSMVASNVDCGIYLNSQREVAVPASKSFSSQVTALLMMGIWMSFNKQNNQMKHLRVELKENIRQLPINFGLNLKIISDSCKSLAIMLKNETFLMVLGKGTGLSIAKEGALKIKEITYIHAEAFSAGEMKHGPIALLEPERNKTKVILIIMDDDNFQDMLLALDECKARECFAIVITNCPSKVAKADFIITVVGQNWSLLSSLISVTVFQKISLELAKLLELNPDKPRNLAKTVTV